MSTTKTELIPTRNNIIFQFVDAVKNGKFVNERDSGIVVDLGNNHEDSGKYCRVGVVKYVNDNEKDFKPGDKIAINPLMWTESFMHLGEKHWMTIPEQIAAKVN